MSDRNAKLLMWRDWLDIVTERGLIPAGADPDLAADLLVEYGVTPDRDEMTAHGAARDAYHALRDLAGGPVPAFITDALARWDFETAQSAIDAATEAWTTAGSVEGVLPGVEADGGPIQDAVLGSESQDELAAAVTLAGAQRSAAEDVADALAVLAAPRDAIQELGLAGTTLPDGAAAIQAVEDVDADRAAAEADAIRAVIGAARDTGTQRAALIGGGIALVLVLAVVVAVIARRHRGRAAPPSEAA